MEKWKKEKGVESREKSAERRGLEMTAPRIGNRGAALKTD
jgi:hypothetical protein